MKKEEYSPLAAWFLGPKAEHGSTWSEIINYIFQDYIHWRRNYFPEDQVLVDRTTRREHEIWFDKLSFYIDQILNQLKAHYPFYSPRYLAHMLSEQSLPSVVGYLAGMLYNPNNVTAEAAPITVSLELQVGEMISEMLGFDPTESFAHITSGGTIANLEAMWVSRISSFVPLIIQEFCNTNEIEFSIQLPNKSEIDIRNADKLTLLQLVPNESLNMPRKFVKYLVDQINKPEPVIHKFNEHFTNSRYNINNSGITSLYSELGIEPIIYISEAAHYSFIKIGNLLGIGRNAIHKVSVDSEFRIDTDQLKNQLFKLKPNQVVLGVIGIAGTTEEGAIDPIHKIYKLRDELEQEKNRSFWFHVDAAWGGYSRSILHQKNDRDEYISLDIKRDHKKIFKEYFKHKKIRESFELFSNILTVDWKDPELFYALLYMSEADSITIDPHKLGYIPYPSGVICFRNRLMTDLLAQEAPYISDEKIGFNPSIEKPIIERVGPYIIEGSKPGAAAASTWLAHKAIPLNNNNHGKLIRTSLLNARKLHAYLANHKTYFKAFEEETFGAFNPDDVAFSLEPLYEPDCNVVCYIAQPYHWVSGNLVRKDVPLKFINKLNNKIYDKFSLKFSPLKQKNPYGQEYFISRTTMTKETYAAASISKILKNLNIAHEEYDNEGLFVLRSTIMNPWYYMAIEDGNGIDYLFDFTKKLHLETKSILKEMVNEDKP
ncbi:MAG: hypothetical protein KJP00_10110 [Bacteroidia bacterium]|nr:hypothetical protein [Bacteroidia bacterium]